MELLLALGLFLSTHRDLKQLPTEQIKIISEQQLAPQPKPTPIVKKVVQPVKKTTITKKTTPKTVKVSSKVQTSSAKKIQCVAYARQLTGMQIKGNANTWVKTAKKQGYTVSSTPVVGSVLSEPRLSAAGHVSVVIEQTPTYVVVKEANYIAGKITTRKIAITGSQQFILPKS